MRRALPPLCLGLALMGACQDPVQDADVAALGPEVAGVAPGPLHRVGQPCLVCHGGSGPAALQLAFGGTLYEAEEGPLVPLVSATVTLTDARGRSASAVTNAVGNFYVPASSASPSFPVTVALESDVGGTRLRTSMLTFIGRDGSCADCHRDPSGPTSAGHVWLVSDPSFYPGATP